MRMRQLRRGLRVDVIVPSGGAVGPKFDGFIPVIFDRNGTPMLAVFTSFELRPRDLRRHHDGPRPRPAR